MKRFSVAVLLAPVVFLTCARGPEVPTAATRITPVSASDGAVSSSALGDEKTGTGDLEIFNVRMDRQNAITGASIVRVYADPGRTYQMGVGEQIELWVEYRGVPNPRVKIDWGAPEVERLDGRVCGNCLFFHTYKDPGTFTVVVTVDDRAGTVVRRTFVLNSIVADPTPPAILNVAMTGGFCGTPHLTGPGGIDCTHSGGACSATFNAGTVVTLTLSNPSCTNFNGWLGACASVGTGSGNSASCTLTLASGITSVTLKTFNGD